MRPPRDEVLVLGAGLAGLSAGHALARAGAPVRVVEKERVVGGLARTVARGPFRFDLGGHRFVARDQAIARLARDLLGEEALTVARRSQILLRGRYIDYPLRPLNALAGLGAPAAARVVLDHAWGRLAGRLGRRPMVSLEDWVVRHFGRALFDVYFREYSEKVWGIGCDRISMDWVARRIQGLSLGRAIRAAFFPRHRRTLRTLADEFLYPAHGIGRIAERLAEEIERENLVQTGAEVRRIHHRDFRVRSVELRAGGRCSTVAAGAVVSTVPLGELVRMLDPRPPPEILRAAAGLRFRDLIVVAVMLDRERVTRQSWLYFPERRISFGRIHEPTNWSARMAPPGKTLLVAERFCFAGDDAWRAGDAELADRTIRDLGSLGIVSPGEVLDSSVLRVPRAYPVFEVGYREHRAAIQAYLGRFANLAAAGRGGTFSYHDMDDAMASGIEAAHRVLGGAVEAAADRPAARQSA